MPIIFTFLLSHESPLYFFLVKKRYFINAAIPKPKKAVMSKHIKIMCQQCIPFVEYSMKNHL